jgi:acetylornithine deacetylase
MDLFQLTRTLVDIESTTPAEGRVADFLYRELAPMAAQFGGRVEKMPVEPNRDNVLVCFGEPLITLSTHMDTVPPFFGSREDATHIWGRGSCDAKGIIAAMIEAARRLLQEGVRNIGLLFLVGEERNSAGALVAAKNPRGATHIICGEPTQNRLAIASKGVLRYLVTARGKLAHSAYPELGESAIEKLLDALAEIRAMPLPRDEQLGPSTLNIGTIEGGHAPNVIADHAQAEILIRLVSDAAPLREALAYTCDGRAEAQEVLCIPAVRLGKLDGYLTTIAAFTTDIPALGDAWGTPYLIGPGDIRVAHTAEERVTKQDLLDAVETYVRMVKQFQAAA